LHHHRFASSFCIIIVLHQFPFGYGEFINSCFISVSATAIRRLMLYFRLATAIRRLMLYFRLATVIHRLQPYFRLATVNSSTSAVLPFGYGDSSTSAVFPFGYGLTHAYFRLATDQLRRISVWL